MNILIYALLVFVVTVGLNKIINLCLLKTGVNKVV